MKSILSFLLIGATAAQTKLRVIGWYDGFPSLSSPLFPWETYTHLRVHGPMMIGNQAFCNHTQMDGIVDMARKHNVSVLWDQGINASYIVQKETPEEYWDTIGKAVQDCNIDGIEVDLETLPDSIGLVSPRQANKYSLWLSKLRKTIQKPVGCDISLPGIGLGNWILGWLPWINVTMLNKGEFDWVSTMSYHWNKNNNIFAWEKDVWVLKNVWKIDPQRINLGIGYFSKRWGKDPFRLMEEPTWQSLSSKCPNVSLNQTICDDVLFVSKKMNYDLGKLIRKEKIGGMFPWMIDYDSYQNNNTLSKYLIEGYNNHETKV